MHGKFLIDWRARRDYFGACGPSPLAALGVALKGDRHRRFAALSSNSSVRIGC